MGIAHGNSTDRRVGRVLGGKWRIDAILGEGATSRVYSATNRGDGSRAAIKILHGRLAADVEAIAFLFAERDLVARVDHPGIVRVFDDGITDDGSPYLVLELLSGQTLEDLRMARGGQVPLAEAMAIGDAVMDALAAVHDARVVHRDLKPQNILVLDGGGIKLLDFGLAKVRGRTADAAGSVVGTPSFMPPEQALGLPSKMDAQSDVWALGATLFHILSGQPVHIAKDTSAMLLASASVKPRSVADVAPDLPAPLVEVIDRALAYRKANRWSDVRAMREAWLAAHPPWLPTLPPPSFEPDPEFLDADLLESVGNGAPPAPPGPPARPAAIRTPLAMAAPKLSDLRDLEHEAVPRQLEHANGLPAKPRRKLPSLSMGAVVGGALAFLAVAVTITATVLATEDTPRAARAATPPPPAMDLAPQNPSATLGATTAPSTR
jgi:eukaryotic-like serine/threonine-protein kinase